MGLCSTVLKHARRASLVWMCCFKFWWEDEVWSRMSCLMMHHYLRYQKTAVYDIRQDASLKSKDWARTHFSLHSNDHGVYLHSSHYKFFREECVMARIWLASAVGCQVMLANVLIFLLDAFLLPEPDFLEMNAEAALFNAVLASVWTQPLLFLTNINKCTNGCTQQMCVLSIFWDISANCLESTECTDFVQSKSYKNGLRYFCVMVWSDHSCCPA